MGAEELFWSYVCSFMFLGVGIFALIKYTGDDPYYKTNLMRGVGIFGVVSGSITLILSIVATVQIFLSRRPQVVVQNPLAAPAAPAAPAPAPAPQMQYVQVENPNAGNAPQVASTPIRRNNIQRAN